MHIVNHARFLDVHGRDSEEVIADAVLQVLAVAISIFVILNYGSEQVQEPDAIGRIRLCNFSTVSLRRTQNIQDLIFFMTIPVCRRSHYDRRMELHLALTAGPVQFRDLEA